MYAICFKKAGMAHFEKIEVKVHPLYQYVSSWKPIGVFRLREYDRQFGCDNLKISLLENVRNIGSQALHTEMAFFNSNYPAIHLHNTNTNRLDIKCHTSMSFCFHLPISTDPHDNDCSYLTNPSLTVNECSPSSLDFERDDLIIDHKNSNTDDCSIFNLPCLSIRDNVITGKADDWLQHTPLSKAAENLGRSEIHFSKSKNMLKTGPVAWEEAPRRSVVVAKGEVNRITYKS
ncbi:hypothetical protein K501DRAFT_311702 [Backusella circina FSU 941]|nr:hypothetical protein K501DRAFT_311702 [Backusella circina FSU 941]